MTDKPKRKRNRTPLEVLEEVARDYKLKNKQKAVLRAELENPNATAKDVLLSAGYSNAMANTDANSVILNPRVSNARQALLAKLGSEDWNCKINQAYDDLVAIPSDSRNAQVKAKALDQLHRVRGDYAPVKSSVAKINFSLPDMDDD